MGARNERIRRGRRRVLVAIAALVASFPLQAQTARKVGILSLGVAPAGELQVFQQELARLGHVEGRNLTLEWRFADGSSDRLAAQASELVTLKPDAIFAVSTPSAVVAKKATREIPIVFARVGDPLRAGLVKSMARPEANVTGISSTFVEVAGKQIEMLKAALPQAKRVGGLWYKRNEGSLYGAQEFERASLQLGMTFHALPVERAEEIPAAFQTAKAGGAAAIVVAEDLFVASNKSVILDQSMKHSLPVIAVTREFAEAGALTAYGPSAPAMYRRAAQYVDRILRGTRVGDLPVERPATYELFVNARTAQALGLTLPSDLLTRANAVIR